MDSKTPSFITHDNANSVYDHKFIYQPTGDKNIYQISCNLISHSLIVQFLNKRIYGIELRQGEESHEAEEEEDEVY